MGANSKDLVVCFSGGRTSGYMAKWLIDNKSKEYNLHFVFNNTGKERSETLDFVDRCDKEFGLNLIWIETVVNPVFGFGCSHKVVTFNTASRHGEPFEEMIKKYGIPNKANPQCSRELKMAPTRSWMRENGLQKAHIAIGIRIDEIDRMREDRKKARILYPLISMIPTKKNDVNIFWSKQSFDLQLKSYEGNCDLCWKKSNRKLKTILKENPNIVEWWNDMEIKYGNYVPKHKEERLKNIEYPIRFFRGNKSAMEILNESMGHFEIAKDESKIIDRQGVLFDVEYVINEEDENNGCEETCEPF